MPGPRETSLGAKKMIEPQCEIPQATAALQLSRFLGRNGKGYIVMYHLLLMFPHFKICKSGCQIIVLPQKSNQMYKENY